MKQPRKTRWEGYAPEQMTRALADDIDELEAIIDEHIEDDMDAHEKAAEVFQEWKLSSLRSQNRMLFAVVLALISAIVAILVPLLTR